MQTSHLTRHGALCFLVAVSSTLLACTDPSTPQNDDGSSTSGSPGSSSTDDPIPTPGTTDAASSSGEVDLDTTASTVDESSGSDGDTGSGTTSGDMTDDTSSDSSSDSSSGEPEPMAPPWMVALDNSMGNTHVVQFDIETAAALDFCTVTNAATGGAIDTFIFSSTFSRDDRLFFSTGDELWELALPSCEATLVGDFGFADVYAIAPDEGNDLFGIDADTDSVLRIDADTGVGTVVGPIGEDWNAVGLTLNEDTSQLLALDIASDSLYEIDTTTGAPSLVQALAFDFAQVAFEYHGSTGRVYACASDNELRRIEDDGSLTMLGQLPLDFGCLNMAAPWLDATGLPPMP
ncbi:MAG: hypothetical protein AAF799_20360 [Myxococcota bacterium]